MPKTELFDDVFTLNDKYIIKVEKSEIRQDEDLPYEVATLKVLPAKEPSSFSRNVRADFSGTKTNHNVSFPEMVDLVENEPSKNSTSKSVASYSFETIFNYIAEDYDRLQANVSEYNLYAPYSRLTKQNFLNVAKSGKGIFDYSNGNQMKNFVMPTHLVQQGSEESPYYNYLRINQHIDNGISSFITKLGLFDELLQSYLSGEYTFGNFNLSSGILPKREVQKSFYNVQDFFESDIQMDIDNFFSLERTMTASKMSTDFRKHLLKGFLKNVATVGFRTFEEISRNQKAHIETFCYSIDKYDNVVSEGSKIQTIYGPALEESTPIIDTQVKYGKTYAYRVKGHYLIVGNRYSFNITSRTDEMATIEVTNRPSIVMMPETLFDKKINVIQLPPVKPQVTFKTKNDSGRQISMYLSPTKTETREYFTAITREDHIQALAMEFVPKLKDSEGKFKFKTYGDQGLFEVFRLEHPPTSYFDFANAKIGEVSMPFETTNAIFRDNIVANKRYYYTFRSVNQKGMRSNPTTVYEITLLIDADESKVVSNIYKFPKFRDHEKSLDFNKMLRVTPAVEHLILDESQDVLRNRNTLVGTLDNIKLGIANNSVWGRKFKVRIKSKTSGKILDIILNVDLTKNKTEEEL